MAEKGNRKMSPILKAWRECWREEKVCPMWGVTKEDKARVRACVERKTGKRA